MRLAFSALLPSYLVATILTLALSVSPWPNLVVTAWITCHGLALLATRHFAPRSLGWLGWAFLIAGMISLIPLCHANPAGLGGAFPPKTLDFHPWRLEAALAAQRWMALTFGLLHLAYAGCAWPRPGKA